MRRLRRPFEWAGIYLALLIVPCFTLKGCLRMATFMARCGLIICQRDKRVAEANLRIMYGNRITPYREKVIIYHAFRNMSAVLVTLFWISRHSKKRIERITVIDPAILKIFKQAIPSINVSAHLGNWEMLSQAGVLNDIPMTTVAKDIGSSSMTKHLSKIRSSIGQKIVAKDGALKRLVYALRHNSSLGLVVDQLTPVKEGGVWLKFFGLPVDVSIAPASLSRRFNVPIIVGWARPLKDGCYKIEFLKQFDPDPDIDDETLSQDIINVFEKVIRRHPSCWTLNYRRWRTIRPGDDPARYPFYAGRKKKRREKSMHPSRLVRETQS